MIKLTDVKSTAKTNQNVRVLVGFYSLMGVEMAYFSWKLPKRVGNEKTSTWLHILEARCGESITNLTRLN